MIEGRGSGRRPPAPVDRWSQAVTRTSSALDLEPGVFTLKSARQIALSLRRSAEASTRRKAGAFQSAMSMLTFYINRAGARLPADRRAVLESAKDELRRAFGRATRGSGVTDSRS